MPRGPVASTKKINRFALAVRNRRLTEPSQLEWRKRPWTQRDQAKKILTVKAEFDTDSSWFPNWNTNIGCGVNDIELSRRRVFGGFHLRLYPLQDQNNHELLLLMFSDAAASIKTKGCDLEFWFPRFSNTPLEKQTSLVANTTGKSSSSWAFGDSAKLEFERSCKHPYSDFSGEANATDLLRRLLCISFFLGLLHWLQWSWREHQPSRGSQTLPMSINWQGRGL